LIVSKARFCDKAAPNPAIPEVKDVMEEMIATLKDETRQASVLLILVSEDIIKHYEQLVIGFADEPLELIEAQNRSHSAIQEACKVTLAHEEKSRTKEPQESSSAKAIREFLARQRGRPSN
jgi:hypothetical protein